MDTSSMILPAMPVNPTSIQELQTGVPSIKYLMQVVERAVAGEVRIVSHRESGGEPLCLAPAPSLATSPSSTFGNTYSPNEPCLMVLPDNGAPEDDAAPPA
eukprot:9272833-Heterocapsa_arctica.AAC.1